MTKQPSCKYCPTTLLMNLKNHGENSMRLNKVNTYFKITVVAVYTLHVEKQTSHYFSVVELQWQRIKSIRRTHPV